MDGGQINVPNFRNCPKCLGLIGLRRLDPGPYPNETSQSLYENLGCQRRMIVAVAIVCVCVRVCECNPR